MIFQSEKTNPISELAKNERKLICYRGLWEWNHLQAQKNKPKQTQFQIAELAGKEQPIEN